MDIQIVDNDSLASGWVRKQKMLKGIGIGLIVVMILGFLLIEEFRRIDLFLILGACFGMVVIIVFLSRKPPHHILTSIFAAHNGQVTVKDFVSDLQTSIPTAEQLLLDLYENKYIAAVDNREVNKANVSNATFKLVDK